MRAPCRTEINSETPTIAAEPAAEPTAERIPEPAPGRLARIRAELTLPRLLLVLIAAAAATAYAWQLDTQGLETYYAAGVRSMSGSWYDFWYDAFDPHATVTMDKLPGAFWVQALSVRAFGYSVWALVLPQVLESTLTVFALYRAVRRTAGTGAALIAAAVLAASPVTISSTRGNLSEPLYLLCTVLAVDAVLRVIVLKRARSLVAAAVWVALAFQAKMTEAWLVLPALMLALVAGAAAGRRRAALRAGLLAVGAVALSLVWVCAFALTPAADRPVADGSSHNSVFEQVFLYNGGFRLNGDQGYTFGLEPLGTHSARLELRPGLYPAAAYSQPGWDRLLIGDLAPDCAWLLPLAVAAAFAVFSTRRRAGRGDPICAATLLWFVWLLLCGVAFSTAQHIHDYYLATLVPAIAALTGMGLIALWRYSHRLALPLWLIAGTGWAAVLLGAQPPALSGAVGLAGLVAGGLAIRPGWRRAAVPLGLAALFTGPLVADGWLLARDGGPFDTPFAAVGTFAQPSSSAIQAESAAGGASLSGEMTHSRWDLLMADGEVDQEQEVRWGTEMLTYTSSEASGAVMGGVREIRPIGGFTGDLPYPTADQVERLIKAGRVSRAVVPGPGVPGSTDPRILVVTRLCRATDHDALEVRILYMCTR